MERTLALALFAGLFIHSKLRLVGEVDRGRAGIALLLFLAVNYASVATAVDKGFAFVAANEFAKTVVLSISIITLIEDEHGLRKFLWVYVLAIGWTAGSSVWNYVVHPYYRQGIQRATGLQETGSDPNAIANTLTLAIPILLVLLRTASGWRRLLLGGILAAAIVCTILTGSRNGFVILVLVLVLSATRSAKAKLLVPGLLALIVVGWLAIPTEYQERYKTILPFIEDPLREGKTSEEESAHGRIAGLAVAWQMFTDRPILGVGAGNFPLAWRRSDTPYNYRGLKMWFNPHNLPGKLMAELGLLGIFTFVGYLVAVRGELSAARAYLRESNEGSPFFFGIIGALSTQLVALLVAGLSGHNLYRPDWYVAGALAVVVYRLTIESVSVETEASSTMAVIPCLAEEAGSRVRVSGFAEAVGPGASSVRGGRT
jgi:O-antigen ligase